MAKLKTETISPCVFDCPLQELIRTEEVMDILVHYNLLFPEMARFGSAEKSVNLDPYNVYSDGLTVTRVLLRGGLFTRHILNSWSHRIRVLHLSPSFERLCFLKVGEDTDTDSIPLREIIVAPSQNLLSRRKCC